MRFSTPIQKTRSVQKTYFTSIYKNTRVFSPTYFALKNVRKLKYC
jgi:hypothetical protein